MMTTAINAMTDADDEQHMVLAAFSAAQSNPDTRHGDCLCACAQDRAR
jgi:hypothetical protein